MERVIKCPISILDIREIDTGNNVWTERKVCVHVHPRIIHPEKQGGIGIKYHQCQQQGDC